MCTVFSNYLMPYIEKGLLPEVDQTKPSDVYNQLSIAYNQGSEGVKHTSRLCVLSCNQEDEDFDYDLLYEIWRNNWLQEYVIDWLNKKIFEEKATFNGPRCLVLQRIALSRLNKLVDEGHLDKDYAIKLGLNLIDNLENERNVCINENLPFQGCPLEVVFDDNSPHDQFL